MRLPNIDPEVWGARPLLGTIRAEAHRRAVGADAVLWGVLVQLAGHMDARVHIETGIGAPLRPSLFTVLAGPSGASKSSGWSVARALLPTLPEPLPISTGEGLVESYYGRVLKLPAPPAPVPGAPEPEGPAAPVRPVWTRVRVRDNAVAYVDEGEGLFAQLDRPGNVVGSVLRAMWSGSTAGQVNADPERARTLDAGTYSLGLAVGLQPDIAGRLVADVATGMAQRFTWVAVTDGGLRNDVPAWATAHPTYALPWSPPELPAPDLRAEFARQAGADVERPAPVPMALDVNLAAGLRAAQIARVRGDVEPDPRDSQRPALHVKIAAVLAWLDRRLAITPEDWQLAAALLATSDEVRAALAEHADTVTAARRAEQGLERSQIAAAAAAADTLRPRARERVLELLATDDALAAGVTGSGLRRGITGALRPHLADVLAGLTAAGHVAEEPAGNGGSRYRLNRRE